MDNKHKVVGILTDTKLSTGERREYGAIGWYRIVNPLKKLGANIISEYPMAVSAESALDLKSKGDIWFTKMCDNEGIDHRFYAHKEFTGAKLVLDLDDEPYVMNEDHPDIEQIREVKEMWRRMIKIADHIVCSTNEIATSIKEDNPYSTVIPNSIDPKIWDVKKKKRKDGKIRIVWIASGSHMSDKPLIDDAISEILAKYPNVEFHMAGIVNEDEEIEDRVFHHKGTDGYKEFPQWYADLGADIAIAPLIDTKFNRAKSNIKWLESAMLEIPMVASDVKPYQDIKHGETGYLATTGNQFTKYLSWLIENPELRKRIGKSAKNEVLKNWTIDKFLPMYEELFNKLNDKKDITVITAITNNKDDLIEQPQYPGVKYLAFTDKKSPTWETRKPCDKFLEPVMNAKIHKILSHKYCDTPYIVWVDGNMELKQDPHELVKLMGKKDFAFFKHPGRDCLFEEADACISLGKGKIEEIGEQIKQYAKDMFPDHAGLCECTAFIRKNNKKANETFEKWWAEICRYSHRDQLSFPVAFQGKKWATIPGSVQVALGHKNFSGNKYFKYKMHNHFN